ncbi:MAG: hypothetical protein KF871_13990 [Hydrogenophaga sp.]|uniref:hypothetical protein n=1 Tax=Hydrogenophaga sp. TaxID=1904254 RepID=UPI001DF94818|nr:hypothetical protein [Hydrogenophaga sp.]MBX3610997.1 hypothetical protein [Hydrogenophaga sp.]
MIAYKIFGLNPGEAEGLLFHSCVAGLDRKPYLWADECPFPIPAHVLPRVVSVLELEDAAQADVA